jgi:hypothetical protein
MPKKQPVAVKTHLDKCRAVATAAVAAYNNPTVSFRTAIFLVLITMAWTAAFHAYFFKRNTKPWHLKKPGKTGKAKRYATVDGEPRHWELSECAREFFGGTQSAVRKNLDFLVGLRNKIEHRQLPELDASLYGECQAALLNLESFLLTHFGDDYALSEQLAISLQFSATMPREKILAAKNLARRNAKTVRSYVETFRGRLPAHVLNDTKYSFNVYLVPKTVGRESAADAAVKFIDYHSTSQQERSGMEQLNVLIKEKHVPVSNLHLKKPRDVVKAASERLGRRVTVFEHTKAWQQHSIRPGHGSAQPHLTDSKYCVYDHAHGDYLYTDAWIERFVSSLLKPPKKTSAETR